MAKRMNFPHRIATRRMSALHRLVESTLSLKAYLMPRDFKKMMQISANELAVTRLKNKLGLAS